MPNDAASVADLSSSEQILLKLLEDRLARRLDEGLASLRQDIDKIRKDIDEALESDDDDEDDEDEEDQEDERS